LLIVLSPLYFQGLTMIRWFLKKTPQQYYIKD
jgi:hypothetical protein